MAGERWVKDERFGWRWVKSERYGWTVARDADKPVKVQRAVQERVILRA